MGDGSRSDPAAAGPGPVAHAGEFGQYNSREGDCDLSMRLSNATLGSLPGYIGRPGYDPSALRAGIVHLGLGAFHRAHQAVYTEAVLRDGDLRWGITAASLRSPAMRDALAPQDGLYTVAVRGNGEHLSVVGAIKRILVAPEDPSALIAAMAHPATEIVSLTVTEKAYCHDPATGTLDEAHPDILHDLAHPEAPRSALGFLAAGLARRRADGLRPFTVLCCDNLPANGRTVHRLLSRYAALLDRARERGLAAFIAAEVACPDTMVDRIVPATTDADRGAISSALGMDDAWPVVTEPFSQWVVQDRFSLNRPAWEAAGVTLVDDVAPYEAMKLRMLNASHSALAYLGYLAGAETVADAMALPGLAEFAGRVMDEAVPTLPGGLDTGGLQAVAAVALPQPGPAAPDVADRDGRHPEAAAAHRGDDADPAADGPADRDAGDGDRGLDAVRERDRRSGAADRRARPDGRRTGADHPGGGPGAGAARAGAARARRGVRAVGDGSGGAVGGRHRADRALRPRRGAGRLGARMERLMRDTAHGASEVGGGRQPGPVVLRRAYRTHAEERRWLRRTC